MSDESSRGRRRPGRAPSESGSRSGAKPRFDDLDEDDVEDDRDDLQEGRSSVRPARGRTRPETRKPARKEGGLFGARRRAERGPRDQGFDWAAADEEESEESRYVEDREYGSEDDYDEPPRRRQARTQARRRERPTLMDLSTPVFGYAAILPREPGGVHPGYEQFRQEVLTAIQKIESGAKEHGIDPDDAAEARYALCLFMDEQVAESEWSGKERWAAEPLWSTILNDPEGGVHFFEHLESFGDRQRAVKKVYLVCLALGFRGMYAELDPTQQAARIGEIRQKLLRSFHPAPMDNQELLFPEAYQPAEPIDDVAPPPPKWWLFASIGTILVVILIYVLLLWKAGSLSEPAARQIENMASAGAGSSSSEIPARLAASDVRPPAAAGEQPR